MQRKTLVSRWLFVFALSLGIFVGNSGCGVPTNTNPSECIYEGKTHQGGTTFPSSDGCNTCTCIGGKVACTMRVCNPVDCSTNATLCGADSFCPFPEGQCKASTSPLLCQKKPQTCAGDYTPVCGCDDKTYSNACAAHAAGVSVKAKGACVTPPKDCTYEGKTYKDGESFPDKDGCNTCGCKDGNIGCTEKACAQRCGSRGLSPCPTSLYCKFDETCGSTDKGGVCEPIPQACTRDVNPVCGCDNKTYTNPCNAAASGVSVKTQGACPTTTKCLADADCAKGEVCVKESCQAAALCIHNGMKQPHGSSFPAGDGCNTCTCNNGAVTCTKIGCGTLCQSNDDCTSKAQICVNGLCQTALSCQHNGAEYTHGTSFPAGDGCNTCTCNNGAVGCTKIACKTPCSSNKDCASTEYCALGFGICSGQGVCQTRPQACTQVYDPVCSCDGKTYGNSCSAASSGANVRTKGACTPAP